ncbi:MAG: feruloyl-CoA synthase [Pseudomonadota bacterium]
METSILGRERLADISLAPASVHVTELDNGETLLRSPIELEPYQRSVPDMLEHWARVAPGRTLYAERGADQAWRTISYGEVRAAVRSIGQALLERGLSPGRPLMILAPNSIEHALLALAAMYVGVPLVPVAPAYALMSKDYAKLRHVFDMVEPGMVFVPRAADFLPALTAVGLRGAVLVSADEAGAGCGSISFADLLATACGDAVERAFASLTPDTVAKILLTSGSTGMPKGVINTQRMLCSNQQAWSQLYHFLSERPPVLLDWLPWNHTFGGNNNFGLVLRHGGTLHIDSGKPLPGSIEQTVANLREISPSIYFNVPGGYDMLLPYLEREPLLRRQLFENLGFLCYAGASLPRRTWERLQEMAVEVTGRRVLVVSAWGATETAPGATTVYFDTGHYGNIGLPIPGVELKLVPNGDKLEMRVRGPNVTPGYWKRDDLTAAAFDEDGYFRMGDAGRLIDAASPGKGIEFDGRIGEDFKLTSGTWVDVGGLRLKVIAAGAPLIQDAVIAGHNRDEIGLLIFPDPSACRALCADMPTGAPWADVLRDGRVRAAMAAALERVAAQATGGASRPRRALLMAEPPSMDANEMTEKRYINQRAVLQRRAAEVERLYAEQPDPDLLVLALR